MGSYELIWPIWIHSNQCMALMGLMGSLMPHGPSRIQWAHAPGPRFPLLWCPDQTSARTRPGAQMHVPCHKRVSYYKCLCKQIRCCSVDITEFLWNSYEGSYAALVRFNKGRRSSYEVCSKFPLGKEDSPKLPAT